MVKFLTLVTSDKLHDALDTSGEKTTSSSAPGTPDGIQFAALFQLLLCAPSQVLAADVSPVNIKKTARREMVIL